MKLYILVFTLLFSTCQLLAQKAQLDSNAYRAWPSLGSAILSDDGKYTSYATHNGPTGSEIEMTILQSIDGKSKKEFKGLGNMQFASDSKYAVFSNNGSLAIITLSNMHVEYISNLCYIEFKKTEKDDWLLYKFKDKPENLILRNITKAKEWYFSNVIRTWFDESGRALVLETNLKDNESLIWIDLFSHEHTKIYEGGKVDNLVLDAINKQLVFTTNESIWLYKLGEKPICIFKENNGQIDKDLALNSIGYFSKDGQRLFIYLEDKEKPKSVPENVEIWSYQDIKLHDEHWGETKSYLAEINLNRYNVNFLQHKNEMVSRFLDSKETLALIIKSEGSNSERWSKASKMTYHLMNINSGLSTPLTCVENNKTVQSSLKGRYLVYYDFKANNYFSYEIASGILRNLTKDIAFSCIGPEEWLDPAGPNNWPRGAREAVWTENDESVLIYDQYDIWKVDPLNNKKPINLTNGYGLKHRVVFNFALDEYAKKGVKEDEALILNAFDLGNKNNGFYGKKINEKGDPKPLTMGPYIYDIKNSGYLPDGVSFTPIKAKDASVYLVKRMTPQEFPNYYSTRDFKTFKKTTSLNPEKNYNWYITELHSWKSLDGRVLQGVLYKPENFDPNKKYPVIFHYYQRKSNGLNAFITPMVLCGGCNIDIPTYVSKGYLVFTPDIYYKMGDPMQGAYDAVVSAANYVSNLPFVNAKKMGLQGCSFGGLETNYLVTHTNIFAAAVSSSGISDVVSGYGNLFETGYNRQDFYETGQIRMGASLWGNPAAYIKNSPIFQIDKIATPLLIMHTKKDSGCLFSNILEFYLGLRRMGKKAWMLAYSEGNHAVWGKEGEDFSIRMMQFFDHYLKDKLTPVWMLDSDGGERGLGLDSTGRTPGPGLLTVNEQKKVDSLMFRKPIIITIK